nr:unnamed protein product [Spirometra erinaceieuropaei]
MDTRACERFWALVPEVRGPSKSNSELGVDQIFILRRSLVCRHGRQQPAAIRLIDIVNAFDYNHQTIRAVQHSPAGKLRAPTQSQPKSTSTAATASWTNSPRYFRRCGAVEKLLRISRTRLLCTSTSAKGTGKSVTITETSRYSTSQERSSPASSSIASTDTSGKDSCQKADVASDDTEAPLT